MIASKNPVLSKADAFQTQPQQTYPAYGQPNFQAEAPGAYPPQAGYYQPPAGGFVPQQPAQQAPAGVMTIDDVLAKSAITMGLMIAVAALTMVFLPITALWPVTAVCGLAAFGTVFLVSARRNVNPAFVLLYSVVEGVFLGAISKTFDTIYPGIIFPAVFGTFVTAGVVLAGYHFLRIRVTGRLRKMVIVGTIALAAVYFVNFILAIFGIHTGIIGIGPGAGALAMLISALGVGLAVFNLLLDFERIEDGVRNQAPANESWRASFGLVVTMVWLYIELLRILSYFQRS
ncbi:MAG: Bax inhibitor-1/YccA family protein [Propionibacteriaceae bacterium]|nr:Bax inhibitor-1/YccA family protein [Propionibacteriaceae bacterium]